LPPRVILSEAEELEAISCYLIGYEDSNEIFN